MAWVRIPQIPWYNHGFPESRSGSFVFLSFYPFRDVFDVSIFMESWIRINVIDYTANGSSSLGKYWELGLSMCQQDCDGTGAFW